MVSINILSICHWEKYVHNIQNHPVYHLQQKVHNNISVELVCFIIIYVIMMVDSYELE